jgi:tetratricopeptide (TPR) repeat protein
MLHEQVGEMDRAHASWQTYEQGIATNPGAWPGRQANLARSLVWRRMGQNAARALEEGEQAEDLPAFLRGPRPKPLKPPAEACFERAIELAPDELEAHLALVRFQLDRSDDKADAAARRLLERFPDHGETLEELADLCLRNEKHADGIVFFQRALQGNPLNRRVRVKLSMAHLFHARSHAEEGRFEEARSEYQASLRLRDQRDESSVLCKWAACEFKAGDETRAEELLRQASAESGNRLAVAFSILIEVIRLKLPGKLKTRFDREFKAALEEPAEPCAAVALVETASTHRLAGVTYRGQKTHEKKALTYLERLHPSAFSEEQLKNVCYGLLSLKALKLLHKFASGGQERFPKNPHFFYLEAEGYIALGPNRCPIWRAASVLSEARTLAEQLPPDEARDHLLESIEARQMLVGTAGPLGGLAGLGGFDALNSFDDFLDLFGYDDDD